MPQPKSQPQTPKFDPKFQPKQIAPIQYLLRRLNSRAGSVVPGWGTTPLMAMLMMLFFLFLLIILQIFNQSILLQGLTVDWSASRDFVSSMDAPSASHTSFTATATGIFLGLLVFALGCVAFVAYGAFTYPADKT